MNKCSISLENFRNFTEFPVEFDEHANILLGPNGSGKTSLLEAIFFAIFGASFREKDRRALVSHGKNHLKVVLTHGENVIESYMDLHGRRVLRLNGKEAKRGEILARFFAVYSIGKENLFDGPQYERRRILDKLSGAMAPEYRSWLAAYQRVVEIKKKAILNKDFNTLLATNIKLWELYQKISDVRESTLSRIRKIAEIQGAGDIKFTYKKSISSYESLELKAEKELREGKLLVGLNADEVEVSVRGIDVRSFYSHGIKAYLWLNIFINYMREIARESKKTTFLLLDEPFSVLDEKKSQELVENVKRGENLIYFFTSQRRVKHKFHAIYLDYGRVKADI